MPRKSMTNDTTRKNNIRATINAIDARILDLIDQRITAVSELATLKASQHLPVFDAARETRHFNDLCQQFCDNKNGEVLSPTGGTPTHFYRYYQPVFRAVVASSYAVQGGFDVTVLDAGPDWHTMLYAHSHFGGSVQYHYIATDEQKPLALRDNQVIVAHPHAIVAYWKHLTAFEFGGVVMGQHIHPVAYVLTEKRPEDALTQTDEHPESTHDQQWRLSVARRRHNPTGADRIVAVDKDHLLLLDAHPSTQSNDAFLVHSFGSVIKHW